VKIELNKLTVGLNEFPPYLDLEFTREINPKESYWTIEDRELVVTLTKVIYAEVWEGVFKLHTNKD
jgi:hypothetical protein